MQRGAMQQRVVQQLKARAPRSHEIELHGRGNGRVACGSAQSQCQKLLQYDPQEHRQTAVKTNKRHQTKTEIRIDGPK